MTILGIDPSSTAIGLAVIDVDEGGGFELVGSNALDLKGVTQSARLRWFGYWLREQLCEAYYDGAVDCVAIERSTPAMSETVGMVRSAACEFESWDVLRPLHVKVARKLIGVGGNASKQVTAEYVRSQLGDTAAGLDEHSIDAAAVAMAAWYQIVAAKEAA